MLKSLFPAITFGEGKPNHLQKEEWMVNVIVTARRHISNDHRGRFDIIADILGASHGGVKKTSLMYHCNLSFKQLEQYLSFMLKNEFLQRAPVPDDSSVNLFEITDKGKEFVKAYECLEALMK